MIWTGLGLGLRLRLDKYYNPFFGIFFSQKNDLNIEKIKVKFSQIFFTLISTLKEENKIILTKMAPG